MAAPDYSAYGRLLSDLQTRVAGLEQGGGGGNNTGMEARIAKLEATAEHIQQDVKDLRSDFRDLRADFRDLRKAFDRDFRLLLGSMLSGFVALGGIIAKGFHWF